MCIYRCHSCSWLRPPVKHHLNFSELKCVMLHNEATQVHETCCLELHGIAFFQVPSFLFLLGWGGVKPLLFASSLTRGVFRVLAASAGTKMPHTFSSLSSPKEFSRTAVILRFVAVIMNDLATMYAIFKFLKSLSWRFMECLLLRGQEPIKPHQWLEFIFLRITITYHLLVKDSILGRFPIWSQFVFNGLAQIPRLTPLFHGPLRGWQPTSLLKNSKFRHVFLGWKKSMMFWTSDDDVVSHCFIWYRYLVD